MSYANLTEFLSAEFNLATLNPLVWGSSIIPKQTISSLSELTLEKLRSQGVTALAIDYDGVCVDYHSLLPPSEEIREILDQLNQHFVVVILSNRRGPLLHSLMQGLPGFTIVRSDRMKPHPDPYLRAAEAANTPIVQIALIEDRLVTGIAGGNRVGMHTIWFTPSLGANHEPWNVRLYRWTEEVVLKLYRLYGVG